MRDHSQLKRVFIKKWVKGLQACTSTSWENETSISERKKAIKLSADLAMASARKAKTLWSRTVIADASKDDQNRDLLECVLGSSTTSKFKRSKKRASSVLYKLCMSSKGYSIASKKIIQRSCRFLRSRKMAPGKRLMNKGIQTLKGIVPGGGAMDESSLVRETLDYIASLQVQVDVMRSLANASEFLNQYGTDDT